MTTKTNQVRLEIKSRLAALRVEDGKVADIQAVLNPVEARDKKNRPATGRVAILWTGKSRALSAAGNAVKWSQEWMIDVFVDWDVDSENTLDQMKVEIGAALLPKIEGVRDQKLDSLEVSHPANGSGGAVISVEIVTEYVETLS